MDEYYRLHPGELLAAASGKRCGEKPPMKISSVLLLLSVTANVVLGVLVVMRHDATASSAAAPAPGVVENAVPAPSAANIAPPAASPHLHPDDRAFVAQLRAAGYPPEVIRTLVFARVEQRYADQVQMLRHKMAEQPYWRSPAMGLAFSGLSPEERVAARELYKQITAEAKALLGDGDEALSSYEKARRERTMGNLSSDKVRQLEAISTDYNEMMMMLRERTKGGIMLKADREKLRLLEKEQRADLAAVLTPDELLEYDLRGSSTASSVRSRLRYFQPNETEYRALAGIQLELDQKYGGANLSPEEQAQRQAAEKELPTKLQAVLSPERYADYLVMTDGAYSQTSTFLTAVNLDPKLTRDVISIKQDLTRRADAIRDNTAFTPEQKNAQLVMLADEASARLSATLGQQNFATYKKNVGTWMNRFNVKPAAPPRAGPP
jgi:hypothetical protein